MDVTCVFWYGVWKIANSFDITHRNGKLHSMVSCFILLLNMWPESEWSGLKTTMIVILNLNLNILNLNFIWTRADWIQVYESCSIWESHAYFHTVRQAYELIQMKIHFTVLMRSFLAALASWWIVGWLPKSAKRI